MGKDCKEEILGCNMDLDTCCRKDLSVHNTMAMAHR
jgi:hypothetical protein